MQHHLLAARAKARAAVVVVEAGSSTGSAIVIAYEEAVRAAVARTSCGLFPTPPAYKGFCAQRIEAGTALLRRYGLLPADPEGSAALNLARVAGHGALLGRELFWQLDVAEPEAAEPDPFHAGARVAADACGLFNLLVSCFDHALDGLANPADLLAYIHAESLHNALDPHWPKDAAVFHAGSARDHGTRCAVDVAEQFFAVLRAFAAEPGNAAVYRSFQSLLMEAFAAELATLGPWTGMDSEARLQTLSKKDALPAILMIHLAVLAGGSRVQLSPALLALGRAAGEIAGMVDDAIDLPEDLSFGHSNQFLVGRDIGAVALDDELLGLLASGAPDAMASKIGRAFGAAATYAAQCLRDPTRFVECLTVSNCGWLAYPI